ncbi:MarR family transcriptional regulator [Secundilactobacillus paracollinoides]|uniref:MarR family transcriptional regulator n=1 Tax=Secundilactobacillus paracollinoides TaxID=240427 RepID=A0A1B2J198_9LACO|nr:MarR family transcriptional regulator [Secundilactobacillus paracollinoides]ANZ62157.1 MarR family transcriptional regulator [Secundilactobacillus paracollinoides]ANZ63846.1 MarR family transcriptional regulator [Secundilactobacillus paracollinoides]ANZ68104.1 MarR family transcriptional regulator [Secundilactobacillus paracollinoides]
MDAATTKRINDLLTTVYNDILRVEERELKKSRFKDISIKEVHAIDAITMYEHKTTSQVARELKITPGTLTTMINHLVRKGYVVRLRSDDDRRFVRLGLTRRGRLIFRAHESFHRHMIQSFTQDMDDEQVQLIEKALLNLQAFLEFPETLN